MAAKNTLEFFLKMNLGQFASQASNAQTQFQSAMGGIKTSTKQTDSALRTLGNIQAFRKLRSETIATNRAFVQTKAKVQSLAQGLRTAAGALTQLSNKYQNAKATVTQLSQKLTAQKAALTGLKSKLNESKASVAATALAFKNAKTRVQALSNQLKATKTPTEQLKLQFNQAKIAAAQLSQKLNNQKTALTGLKVRLVEAKTEVTATTLAFRNAKTQAQALGKQFKEARAPVSKLSTEFKKAKNSVSELSKKLQTQKAELTALKNRLSAAGVDVRQMASAESRLRTEVNAATASIRTQGQAAQQLSTRTSGLAPSVNRAAESFNGLKMAIKGIVLGTVIAGFMKMGDAIKTTVSGTLDFADATAKMADKIGITTNSLQELTFAASQTGVSQDKLESSMLRFSKRIAEAAKGTGAAKNTFKDLGIELRNADGSLKSVDAILDEVSNALNGMGSAAEKNAAMAALFGREGMALNLTFAKGADFIDAYRQKAQELGIVLSEKLLRGAEAANDALDILSRVIGARIKEAVLTSAPQIVIIAEKLTALVPVVATAIENIIKFAEQWGELAVKIGLAYAGVKIFKAGLNLIVPAMGAAGVAAGALGKALKMMGWVGLALAVYEVMNALGQWITSSGDAGDAATELAKENDAAFDRIKEKMKAYGEAVGEMPDADIKLNLKDENFKEKLGKTEEALGLLPDDTAIPIDGDKSLFAI